MVHAESIPKASLGIADASVGNGRNKGEYDNLAFYVPVRSCRVTIQDRDGITHTVDVTAEPLYQAVAQGLAALRRSDWVAGFQQGIVKVSVADVRIEHQVRPQGFYRVAGSAR